MRHDLVSNLIQPNMEIKIFCWEWTFSKRTEKSECIDGNNDDY